MLEDTGSARSSPIERPFHLHELTAQLGLALELLHGGGLLLALVDEGLDLPVGLLQLPPHERHLRLRRLQLHLGALALLQRL